MRVTNAAACLQTAAGSSISRRRRAAYRATLRCPTASDMLASERAHRRTSRGAIPICPVGQVAVSFTLIRILVAARLYSGRIQLEYCYIYVSTHTVRPLCHFIFLDNARLFARLFELRQLPHLQGPFVSCLLSSSRNGHAGCYVRKATYLCSPLLPHNRAVRRVALRPGRTFSRPAVNVIYTYMHAMHGTHVIMYVRTHPHQILVTLVFL